MKKSELRKLIREEYKKVLKEGYFISPTFKREIAKYIKDNIDNYEGSTGSELHNELFNTGYYIVGTNQAKKKLEKIGVFDVIDTVNKYEKDNFGKVTTDLSDPEKIINMYAYIVGEDVLQSSRTLTNQAWDEEIYDYIDDIKKELR